MYYTINILYTCLILTNLDTLLLSSIQITLNCLMFQQGLWSFFPVMVFIKRKHSCPTTILFDL